RGDILAVARLWSSNKQTVCTHYGGNCCVFARHDPSWQALRGGTTVEAEKLTPFQPRAAAAAWKYRKADSLHHQVLRQVVKVMVTFLTASFMFRSDYDRYSF
ncbi:unnamed protein product, partial [Sphacelaria rigidula]